MVGREKKKIVRRGETAFMSKERINKVLTLNKQEVTDLFSALDNSPEIIDFALMTDGMSNTGYMVKASGKKYLLKLYSNATDKTETGAYTYLKDKINVPRLYYYDCSRRKVPFAYTITEFLDGITLEKYIRENRCCPLEAISEIGRMCAVINNEKNDQLSPGNPMPAVRENILYLIKNRPGSYLKNETVSKAEHYIDTHAELFERIDSESSLCHGDLNYGNVLLSGGKVYFVDFEFACAGSRYHDIGHFFRKKDNEIQALINDRVYDAFSSGYNSVSTTALPDDWLHLAQLCDINAMLCLLNHDKIPDGWVEEIERDILSAIEIN